MGTLKCSIFICTFVTIIISVTSRTLPKLSNDSYWDNRARLMAQDLDLMLGHDLILSPEEDVVNSFLIALKKEEMNFSFKTLDFPPAQSFLASKNSIEKSDIFKFIKEMPKGAVLHSHDMALTSIAWVISELTYWDDLYMCNTTDGFLFFKFFLTPDTSCEWKLVADERASYPTPQDFDEYLRSRLSLYTTDVEETYPDINSIWEAFEQVFVSVTGLLSYSKAWEAYLTQAMQEFMEDKVSYLEFRGVLPLLYEKDGQNYTAEETVAVYSKVIQNFTDHHPKDFFGTRFIFAPLRLVDVETVWGYVRLVTRLRDLYPKTVAGFDLVGQEDLGQPLTAFLEPLLFLREQDPPVPVFFHAGETNWEGMSSDENLFDALLLNTSRIGHGYAIVKHPSLMQLARDNNVPVEICPISNQILMLVNDLRNHPAAPLAATSFPMVVSSDDPAIWEALPLSHDFYEAFVGLGGAKADLKFLKKLALNSIRYSSLNPEEKKLLEGMWNSQWESFILGIIARNHLQVNEESNLIPRSPSDGNPIPKIPSDGNFRLPTAGPNRPLSGAEIPNNLRMPASLDDLFPKSK